MFNLSSAGKLLREVRRSRRLPELLRTTTDPAALADGFGSWSDLPSERKLELLETTDPERRVELALRLARALDALTLGVDSAPGTMASENATFSAFHRFSSRADRVRLRDDSRYRHAKWVSRAFSLEELTFAHPLLRDLAALALDRAEAQRQMANTSQSKRG